MSAETLREEPDTKDLNEAYATEEAAEQTVPGTAREEDGDVTPDEPSEEDGDEIPDASGEDGADTSEGADYSAIAALDLKELKGEFPELCGLEHISGLDNPMRYAALRDLGLSPREAYLATARRQRADGRAHLSSAVPRGAGSPGGGMSARELAQAREIFSDMSDVEIRALYKKVTK